MASVHEHAQGIMRAVRARAEAQFGADQIVTEMLHLYFINDVKWFW
jgi:hypothetical protein